MNPFPTSRRLALAGLLATLALPAAAQQPAWPSRTIRWIVPFPAGGPLDAIARKLGETVSVQVGQPVVIENKTGAYGAVGAAEVARAQADGHTFLFSSTDTFINAMALLKSPPYDSRKDFTFLSQVAESGPVLMLSGSATETSLEQLLARAKASPGAVSYGSWGAGSTTHLMMDAVARQAGVEMLHVPYRGAAPAIQDLLGKQVTLAFAPPNVAAQFAQKGMVKLLATAGDSRSPLLPTVPTFAEQGYKAPILRTRVWLALAGPAGLPKSVSDRMVREIRTAAANPGVAKFIADAGFSPMVNTPVEFRSAFEAEYPMVVRMIQDAGVVPQ
jgi:tripartite-type tricarboxylate transporter receptor subunit TctC